VTLYLAIFDNVLHRLRFSKFLSVVRVDIPEVVCISLVAIILFMLLYLKGLFGYMGTTISSIFFYTN
jgi:hypothetical protein